MAKHKTTQQILLLMVQEYKEGMHGPFTLIDNLSRKKEITAYEVKKIKEFVRNHMPNLLTQTITSINWQYFDVIPNELWYCSLIEKLNETKN